MPTSSPSWPSSSSGSRGNGGSRSSSSSTAHDLPTVSKKIERTLDPCVVLMKELIGQYAHLWEDRGGIFSLAQGVVYWGPPQQCTSALKASLLQDEEGSSGSGALLHMYGPDEGLPELRNLLQDKLKIENGLPDQNVMITAGANQAYVNCVLTLLTENDKSVVFRPYYFNHVMALQMYLSDAESQMLVGPSSDEGVPDLDWLEEQLTKNNHSDNSDNKIKMVTIVNPGNPTGTLLSRETVQRAVDLCRQHGSWLVLDCTYEYFVNPEEDNNTDPSTSTTPFDGCFSDPHVLHIFSFSKSYALAGYRCGYVAVHEGAATVYDNMMKVQDTIPICPSRISQVAAMGALQAGPHWVLDKFTTLATGRAAIMKALQPLDRIMGGTGAMYVMAKLPTDKCADDVQVARDLVRDFGVAVIPGSYCGFPGWIRVCYANLSPDRCLEAADRLTAGIQALLTQH